MTISTLRSIRDVERLFDEVLGRATRELARYKAESPEHCYSKWVPSLDIYENAEAFFLYVDLPGVKREDVSVDVENNLIVIKGKREHKTDATKETLHLVERESGCFYRSFQVPNNVDTENIDAQLADGVLVVKLPKKPETKPRALNIK